jgi:Arc/MetJ-type ribon-helix-helix transcriptional regulator
MARKLKDIDVAEISLVDAAANREKFFIVKRRQAMEFFELLKKFLGDEDVSDEDIAKAKELSEKAIKAIQGALNILTKYKEDMPSDVLNAIKTLTKYASYGYPAKKAELTQEEFIEEILQKAGARLSKATVEQLKKIQSIVEGLIGEKEKTRKDKFGDVSDEVRERLEKLEKLEKEEADRKKKEKEKADADKQKEIDDLKKRLEKLEKKKPVRKSVKGQEGDDDEDDDTVKWPSLLPKDEEGGKE